jgi:hypothetical protein
LGFQKKANEHNRKNQHFKKFYRLSDWKPLLQHKMGVRFGKWNGRSDLAEQVQ